MKLSVKQLKKVILETLNSGELAKKEYEELKSISSDASIASAIFGNPTLSKEDLQDFKDTSKNIQEYLKKVLTASGTRKVNNMESIQRFFYSEKSIDEILADYERYTELSKNFDQRPIHSEENSMYGRGVTGIYHIPTSTLVDRHVWRKGRLGT